MGHGGPHRELKATDLAVYGLFKPMNFARFQSSRLRFTSSWFGLRRVSDQPWVGFREGGLDRRRMPFRTVLSPLPVSDPRSQRKIFSDSPSPEGETVAWGVPYNGLLCSLPRMDPEQRLRHVAVYSEHRFSPVIASWPIFPAEITTRNYFPPIAVGKQAWELLDPTGFD